MHSQEDIDIIPGKAVHQETIKEEDEKPAQNKPMIQIGTLSTKKQISEENKLESHSKSQISHKENNSKTEASK